MNPIDKLAELFTKFPGIGPRQAKRFVYFLLARQNGFRDELSRAIRELKDHTAQCTSCLRYFSEREFSSREEAARCSVCVDRNRDATLLMIVERDVDLEAVEKSGAYHGRYFVLGGRIPILEQHPEERVRLKELERAVLERVSMTNEDGKLTEIVFALSVTPEGENTERVIVERLKPTIEKYTLRRTTLGRGLSTGLELEYSDTETLKNALEGRRELPKA